MHSFMPSFPRSIVRSTPPTTSVFCNQLLGPPRKASIFSTRSSFSLSVCQSISLSIYRSVGPSICWSLDLSFSQSIPLNPCLDLSLNLSVKNQSIYRCVFPPRRHHFADHKGLFRTGSCDMMDALRVFLPDQPACLLLWSPMVTIVFTLSNYSVLLCHVRTMRSIICISCLIRDSFTPRSFPGIQMRISWSTPFTCSHLSSFNLFIHPLRRDHSRGSRWGSHDRHLLPVHIFLLLIYLSIPCDGSVFPRFLKATVPEPRPRSRLFCSHCQCLPRDPGSFGSQAGHPSSLIAISTPLFHSENRCWLFSSSFPQSCGRPPCNLHLTPGMTTYCRHLPQLVAGLIFHDEHPRPHSQFRRRIPPEPKGKAMDPLLDPVSPLSLTSGRSFRLPFWPDIFFQHVDPVSCPHRHESLSWHGLSDYRSFCLFFLATHGISVCFGPKLFFSRARL